jgi:nuclear transport factor 2 (NTF2) superfamily protein
MNKPVVGRDAISKLASQWPEVENIREWRIIEGNRMAVGWRERARQKNGQMGGWYRGISTFVFDANGLIENYEGMFNLEAIRAAYSDG